MTNELRISETNLIALAEEFLSSNGLNIAQSRSLARTLVEAQRDGSFSHGLQRLPGTLTTMSHPQFNRDADPQPHDLSVAAVQIDAQFGFSCLAAERGIEALVEKAHDVGLAMLAVNNGFHSTALWPLVERISNRGLVALSMNPTHAWVAPAGGNRGLLGTNPIAFAWPRRDKPPAVFDFATSAASRADIAMHRETGTEVPEEWGLDNQGKPSRDPAKILAGAMLPFGGHKGSAIALMIELLAGPLIGAFTSRESQSFDQGADAAPCHGELFLAFSPGVFGGAGALDHAETLFSGFYEQGARLPGDRRYRIRENSAREGIRVSSPLLDRIQVLMGAAI
ncbi:Ldh family oxidoreductase [Pseudorhizobium flavum]|uniref:Ldh family oxidoreductase n=1 Tax=Pseudorhizobium flavum TaxID=1335061 RepID=UPI00376F5B55